MGVPEKSAVGALAFTITSMVVCAFFFCGEATDLEQGVREGLEPAGAALDALDRPLPSVVTDAWADEPMSPLPPAPCEPAVVEDPDPLVTVRSEPGAGRGRCDWYPRRGIAPVWAVRLEGSDEGASTHWRDLMTVIRREPDPVMLQSWAEIDVPE